MSKIVLTFIPGEGITNTSAHRCAAVDLGKGRQVLLDGYAVHQPRQREATYRQRVPGVQEVNQLGAVLVSDHNWCATMRRLLDLKKRRLASYLALSRPRNLYAYERAERLVQRHLSLIG